MKYVDQSREHLVGTDGDFDMVLTAFDAAWMVTTVICRVKICLATLYIETDFFLGSSTL